MTENNTQTPCSACDEYQINGKKGCPKHRLEDLIQDGLTSLVALEEPKDLQAFWERTSKYIAEQVALKYSTNQSDEESSEHEDDANDWADRMAYLEVERQDQWERQGSWKSETVL